LKIVEDRELMKEKYNTDRFNGIDGSLIKVSDHIGAFIEAAASIHNGIAPASLVQAKEELLKKYENFRIFEMDIGKFLRELDRF